MSETVDRLTTAMADRYAIQRELGRGGMATVYLATDRKHHRRVALKVLRPELAAALGPERFSREIELAARLTHPHILPLHDSGNADGFLYFVMPYVEGESLRDRLTREKQLPLDDALQISREVADALSYAHSHGVIHRDIKPENILLQSGHAVVADFGIARAIDQAGGATLTETGLAIGTPAYMSPEQATGSADLDGRCDIYALGCVLYEMLAGEPPFGGATPVAILARKAVDPVPSLRVVRNTVPEAVETAIAKALARVPADRFATSRAFADALERSAAGTGAPTRRGAVGQRRVKIGALLAVAILLLAGGWWIAGRGASSRIDSLVVLPLDNRTGDSAQSYFVDGMHEALTAELSQISALKVISRTSAMRYRGNQKPAPQIARELGVRGLIEGSVAREGNRVRITVQLIDGPNDRRVWGHQFDRELRGVLELHTEVARAIAEEIKATLTPLERVRLAAARPVDPAAFELYLLGRHQWNQRTLPGSRDAVENFKKALSHDAAYAPVHAALGATYLWLGEQGGMPQQEGCRLAAAAIDQALREDQSLAEAHVAKAMWQLNCEWNWREAEGEFQRALELNPGSATVHQYYGRALGRVTTRYDEGLRELQRARDLDPLSATIRAYISQNYLFAGQYDVAAQQLLEALAINPDHVLLLHSLGEVRLAQGRWTDAVTYLEKSIQGPGMQSSHYLAMLGAAYARASRKQEAGQILAELNGREREGLVSAFDMAALHAALGDDGQALTWLERGYTRKDYWLVEMTAWPWFAHLRANSRYQQVLANMQLPW
ncbi:MAG: protein kinase [Gemmatimonadaceae bacterium]